MDENFHFKTYIPKITKEEFLTARLSDIEQAFHAFVSDEVTEKVYTDICESSLAVIYEYSLCLREAFYGCSKKETFLKKVRRKFAKKYLILRLNLANRLELLFERVLYFLRHP